MLQNPYLLLTLSVFFWSGNFVIARAVAGDIPPIALSFWRWAVASLIILPWVVGPLRRQWWLLRRNLPRMLVLALLSVAAFNTLVYLGLQTTTAINGLLLQSSMPLQIIVLNWIIYRCHTTISEGISVLVSLCGVLLIIGAGDPLSLLQGEWRSGDLWILAAVFSWGFYTLFLHWRPEELEPLAFLGFIIPVGALMILPLYLWELSSGVGFEPSTNNLLAITYVGIFPSVFSYLFWNRGVQALGANKAGHFIHLNPVFGSILAVLFLGEVFAWYHLAGALLVGMAIVMSLRPARER